MQGHWEPNCTVSGSKVTMTASVTLAGTVNITSGTIELDLVGFAITGAAGATALSVSGNPSFTVTDSATGSKIIGSADSSGDGNNGGDGSLRFRSTGSFLSFRNVAVDGKTIKKDADYTAAAGSTIIALKPEHLATRSVGKHTMRLTFTGGYSVTTFMMGEKTAWVSPFADVTEIDWFFGDEWIDLLRKWSLPVEPLPVQL